METRDHNPRPLGIPKSQTIGSAVLGGLHDRNGSRGPISPVISTRPLNAQLRKRTRLEFKCRACLGQFSPTTFNEFRCTKVPYTKLVRMVRLCWQGKNAYQIHVLAAVNYRTARLFTKRLLNGAYIRSDRRSLVSKGSGGKRAKRRLERRKIQG
jgi:hypothetical protein